MVLYLVPMLDVMTTAKFSKMIVELSNDLGVSLMDAIVHYCDRNNIEIETAAKLCNKKVKEQIKVEAIELKMVKYEH